jgi:hypothetical protein
MGYGDFFYYTNSITTDKVPSLIRRLAEGSNQGFIEKDAGVVYGS